jgi:hypothetical protein
MGKMKFIITENQYKRLGKQYITESEEPDLTLTPEDMEKIREYVIEQVKGQYEWLKKQVEEGEDFTERFQNYINKRREINVSDEDFDMVIKMFEPRIKDYKRNKESLENFDFEKSVEDGIERDIHGGAYTMSYRIRYDKWKEHALNRKLTKDDIIDLFITSLEGGSNYWYHIDLPKDIRSYGQSISEAVGNYIMEGGTITFYDDDEYERVIDDKESGEYTIQGDVVDEKSFLEDIEETKLGEVNLDRILEAITIIKEKYPRIWENILLENADAGDADVFLQLCVMGEVVYG